MTLFDLTPAQIAQKYFDVWILKQGFFPEYPQESWDLFEYTHDIVKQDAEKGLAQVQALIAVANTIEDEDIKYKWLFMIAAGEYEELIASKGEAVIDEVIDLMEQDDNFLLASAGVWPQDRAKNDPVWVKFKAAVQLNLASNAKVSDIIEQLNEDAEISN